MTDRRDTVKGLLLLVSAALVAVWLVPIASADPPAGYYDTVDATNATTLRATLHEVIDDHTRYPYTSTATDTWDILDQADEDPNNSNNILDVYRNASYPKAGAGNDYYNREHTWPNSYGYPNDNAQNYPYTDCHALFLSDDGYNSSRSNHPYRYCDAACTEKPTDVNNGQGGGSGTYPGNSNWDEGAYTEGTWETWIGRRGDVARAQFYMDIRYEGGTHGVTDAAEPDLILTDTEALIDASNTGDNEPVAYMGMLSVLLQWHLEDPVDDVERARNDLVASYQGNRNPFIDHPEWVECLFNDVCGCSVPADCDDGLWCNGAEDCVGGSCVPGTEPDCSDGVACTDDSCNEDTDSCDNVPNDLNCDNGLYCDGVEVCSATLGCQPGTAVDCNDGVGCTDDSCNEDTDSCDNVANDANCPDDGLFCNGTEYCDAVADCDSTGDPCTGGDVCNEDTDTCDPGACDGDGTCETGEDCNNCPADCISGGGSAYCGDGVCQPSTGEDCLSCPGDCNGKQVGAAKRQFCCGDGAGTNPVDCTDARCSEDTYACSDAPSDPYCCGDLVCEGEEDEINCAVDCGCTTPADCDDLLECTLDDCVGGVCENTPVADDTPCTGGLCCGGICTAPACSSDAECDDSESCTTDTCVDAGMCAAFCDNVWPTCGPADGCCGPGCDASDPDCDTCLVKGEACTDDSECCSNWCHRGTCK